MWERKNNYRLGGQCYNCRDRNPQSLDSKENVAQLDPQCFLNMHEKKGKIYCRARPTLSQFLSLEVRKLAKFMLFQIADRRISKL